ncbi:MAG: hypothetical protein K0Q73_6283 [Paenibacillus sp.]|jgi:hypothetical protein|nr:hypothetical protein [Paenibacillus sp.]
MMSKKVWSHLTGGQLGRYAEYHAKMDFAAEGFHIYTSEVDDHGIDFIAKKDKGFYFEIQVKSIRPKSTKYVFVKERKFDVTQSNLFMYLMLFEDGTEPSCFLIPAKVFAIENSLIRHHLDYKDPELGLNVSKKNIPLLNKFKVEDELREMLFVR